MMPSEELIIGVVLIPLLLVVSLIGLVIVALLWAVLPKCTFKKVVGWIKKLKDKLQDDNV